MFSMADATSVVEVLEHALADDEVEALFARQAEMSRCSWPYFFAGGTRCTPWSVISRRVCAS